MKTSFLTLLLLSTICSAFAQLPDSLKSHLDSAISLMQENSLYARRVNWENARKQAYAQAAGAKNREQLFPSIAAVYRQLDDHHGWFEQYTDKIKLTDSSAIKRYTPRLMAEWANGPKIKAEMIGDVAYLRMPGMPVVKQEHVDLYANWLADSVISLAKRNPKGWIIDLRMNTGGNIRPMMSGLASFFGEGILSYYLDKDNKPVSTAEISNGIFYLDDNRATLKNTLPALQKAKVAVIIGPGTASSGEGLAVHFKDRKNSRLFGERTAGLANATTGFVFNNDNSYFLLTTAVIGNAKQKALPEFVLPKVKVTHNDLFTDLPNDHAVKAALEWLK